MAQEAAVLTTLLLLLKHYFIYAWPFVFLHAIILMFVVIELANVYQEIRGLVLWRQDGQPRKSGCAAVLQQFAEESKRWGPRGVFVPMTDFSDRLDSYVSGKIDTLHSHINLFLIVGVAGTFFAMFNFAISATRSGVTAPEISQSLAKGLSYAFPVGFMGLILSVLFHFAAYWTESRLSSEVNEATRSAMMLRQQEGKGVLETIEESLKPLHNLQQTLQGSLQPVIEGFRLQLDATSKVITEQIQPLSKAVAAFGTSVEGLTKPSQALADAARELPSILQESTRIQTENRSVLLESANFVKDTAAGFQRASASLDSAVVGWQSLPAELKATFDEQLIKMSSSAGELWESASRDFFLALKPACRTLEDSSTALGASSAYLLTIPNAVSSQIEVALNHLTSKAEEGFRTAVSPAFRMLENSSTALSASSTCLSAIPERLSTQLEVALNRLTSSAEQSVNDVRVTYHQELRSLSDESFRTWAGSCGAFVNRMHESTTAFHAAVRKDTETSKDALGEASRKITEICNSFDHQLKNSVAELYRMSLNELQPHLQRLDEAVVRRYPALLENLTTVCGRVDDLKTAAERVAPAVGEIESGLKAAAAEWQKSVEEARNLQKQPAPERLETIQDIRKAIGVIESIRTLMARRLGRPPWKTWFEHDGVES